jgi:hypothetical protein
MKEPFQLMEQWHVEDSESNRKLCRPVYSHEKNVGISINRIVFTEFFTGKTAYRKLPTTETVT